MMAMMHAEVALDARSRIRDNDREAACEEGVAEDGSSRRYAHLDRLLDRTYTCSVRHSLPDQSLLCEGDESEAG
jgi:hypothetical protein